jgi:hypothetical protein
MMTLLVLGVLGIWAAAYWTGYKHGAADTRNQLPRNLGSTRHT